MNPDTEFRNIRREARSKGIDFWKWTTAEREAFVCSYVAARRDNHAPSAAFEIALRHSSSRLRRGLDRGFHRRARTHRTPGA
jgi:hypothetical protein